MIWLLLLILLLFGPPLLARRQGRRGATAVPYRYRPMKLLIGSPGTGKSYYLTYHALRSLAEGRRVLVNFGLRPERVYIALRLRHRLDHRAAMDAIGRIDELRSYDDLIAAKNCDVFIDEVQDLLNGQAWSDIPWPVIQKLAQHRHFKLRIIMCCHRFLSLHTYVREGLVAHVYVARSAPPIRRMIRGVKTMLIGPQPTMLHYMQVKDEADELAKDVKKRKGFLARYNSSESVPLDALVAESYDHIGGVFESPLSRILRDKKGHDLITVREPEPHAQSYAVDGLPSLTISEVAELADSSHLRAAALHSKFAWDERPAARDKRSAPPGAERSRSGSRLAAPLVTGGAEL